MNSLQQTQRMRDLKKRSYTNKNRNNACRPFMLESI